MVKLGHWPLLTLRVGQGQPKALAKKHGPGNIIAKLRLNLLSSSSGIALTRSYAEKCANDPFLTLKVGQPKAFQKKSMGQEILLPNFIEIRSVVLLKSR
jgi:hypothetical protein